MATDGHRLALCEAELETKAKTNQQVILPRKGVLELQRILGGDGNVDLAIGTSHVRAQIGDIRFTSKLIDGRFPEYGRVIPANPTKQVEADREGLRQALQRTAILSNEKYRGVRINLKSDLVTIQAHNPEQEEAEDQVDRTLAHPKIEVHTNTEVAEVLGDAKVEGLRIRDTETGDEREMAMEGLFVAIGHKPNTGHVPRVARDGRQGLPRRPRPHAQQIEGVFIAGDVHDHRYRQAVTAAGDGCKAAIDAERWLEERASRRRRRPPPGSGGRLIHDPSRRRRPRHVPGQRRARAAAAAVRDDFEPRPAGAPRRRPCAASSPSSGPTGCRSSSCWSRSS